MMEGARRGVTARVWAERGSTRKPTAAVVAARTPGVAEPRLPWTCTAPGCSSWAPMEASSAGAWGQSTSSPLPRRSNRWYNRPMNQNVTEILVAIRDAVLGFASDLTDLVTGVQSIDAKVANPMPVLPPQGTWTPPAVAAPADSGVISGSATTAVRLMAANSSGDDTFLQVFDSATVPADGASPRLPSVPINAGQTIILDLGNMPFASGLVWSASSTANVKTIPAPAINALQVSAEIYS